MNPTTASTASSCPAIRAGRNNGRISERLGVIEIEAMGKVGRLRRPPAMGNNPRFAPTGYCPLLYTIAASARVPSLPPHSTEGAVAKYLFKASLSPEGAKGVHQGRWQHPKRRNYEDGGERRCWKDGGVLFRLR